MASSLSPRPASRQGAALLIVALLIVSSWVLGAQGGPNRILAFSLIAGSIFGLLLQRSRFCFFCITRDFIDDRDSRGLLGIVIALIVGTLGYHAIFGAILPVPGDRLPPDAHIGPVSWVLALAALVFGAGMSISGSCISSHMYRLGEGSAASALALLGALVGFGLGFVTWNTLYLNSLQGAPVMWLPRHVGYGGSLLLQLGVLVAAAVALMRLHRSKEETSATAGFWQAIVERRWPAYVGGLGIGFLGTVAYFRVEPLGVTAELGSIARTAGTHLQLLPQRLEGLDGYAGCATVIKQTLLSNNGVFVLGLIIASLASALFCGNFRLLLPTWRESARVFGGGILLGWGAMTALGCTVGTLLSGIMAAALSGWVFAVFCFLGLWITWILRKRFS